MKKVIASLLVLSLLVIGYSSFGSAYGGPGYGGMMGRGNRAQYNYNNNIPNNPLNLNEEQQEKLLDLREEFFSSRNEKTEELRDLNRDLRGLVLAEASDEEISSVRNKIDLLQNELLTIKTTYWNGLKGILTTDQLEEMEKYQEEVNFGRGGRWNQQPMMRFGGRGMRRTGSAQCPFF